MKRAEQKEKRRQEILNVGLDLLIRKGYAAVRTADIAKEAGISEGLFFHYFATKEKLYLTLLQIAASGKSNIFAAEAESAIRFFEQTAKTVLDYISQQPFAAKLFVLMNRASYDDALPEQAKGFVMRKNDVESAVKRIEQGQKEGDIRSGNATALAIAFFMAIQGIAENIARYPHMPVPQPEWIVDILRRKK